MLIKIKYSKNLFIPTVDLYHNVCYEVSLSIQSSYFDVVV